MKLQRGDRVQAQGEDVEVLSVVQEKDATVFVGVPDGRGWVRCRNVPIEDVSKDGVSGESPSTRRVRRRVK